ncbi:hypothetical protein H1R17_10985 [Flavobacterium sp. xlx-214]|uniref:hypothetical protein n=1 Tax=unclassified Flavobacterium TaxID=196869 RepID=UPI0013D3E5FE|nr:MULTISPECIES: hypothetical protein [unclassified Flavobacterium]MBA5791738.1 hypothetical protein [Flavobacterium sp. xlx-221]QMI82977.1 hypothetical protein H1R17_10985 [Flavobacterium sp. xlx-214]
MKYLLLYLSILTSSLAYSQQEISKEVLMGSWKFIQLQDENGVKHTEIPMYFQGEKTVEIINRDDYIFFENGDYKCSNKYSSGGGKWIYNKNKNKNNNTIDLTLRILSDNPSFQSLLNYNVVSKAQDGYYYQKPISLRIESYSDNQLIIADSYPYVLVYKRL